MLHNLIAHHLLWTLGALTLAGLAVACVIRVSVRGAVVLLIAAVLYVIFT